MPRISKAWSVRLPLPPIQLPATPFPPRKKPLKTPWNNLISRTPQARPTPASTPAPALR